MENRRQRFPRPRAGATPIDAAAIARALDDSPHRPVLLREVLRCLQPGPGSVVIDATLGGGGHAQALLAHIAPRGRLLGLDVDAGELSRTVDRLRAAGHTAATFEARHGSFADLPQAMAEAGIVAADAVLVDLGVSAMQHDTAARGFSFRGAGPLDMRMDPSRGETAADLLGRISVSDLAALLASNADEPHAAAIAAALQRVAVTTTHKLVNVVREAVMTTRPETPKADVKMSVRRTLQALRIAVNDEFTALERLLEALPHCLAPGGRVAILTFHSGEDRRVKKALQAGQRRGVYASVAREAVRSTIEETRANRRCSSAKLRWAVRATPRPVRARPGR